MSLSLTEKSKKIVFVKCDKIKLKVAIEELRLLQLEFLKLFKVDDIFSNSKIYEIIIANELGHTIIPGHSGSRDAKDNDGKEIEYKHFKETSSNHSWTFNDYSDTTIAKMKNIKEVVFAHIDDTKFPPVLDWYIAVDGNTCSDYIRMRVDDLLARRPKGHVNNRRMINISASQLERDLKSKKTIIKNPGLTKGTYSKLLLRIYKVSHELELLTSVKNILTSNKIWEVVVSLELDHTVNPEQGGRLGAHDAFDINGNNYEYKVSKQYSWQFQDISSKVLLKYLNDKEIILAVVDKKAVKVKNIYSAEPQKIVDLLINKLKEKDSRYKLASKEVRRLQVSLSKNEILSIGAKKII